MLKYCRADGTTLVILQPASSDNEPTVDLSISQQGAETTLFRSSPSIAVLPFVHMSSDPDNDYFCDGLAEELLNALAKIEGLKVAARTSAFSFKGKDAKIGEIGQALNVSTVLEGSVRKSGDRLRITAQLINVSDGYHLWSERYDRLVEDVFNIQDEITLAIVDALKVKLLGREKSAVLKRYTDNIEAYEYYLKGRYHFNKFMVEGWKRAIEYFEEATRIEPEYAPAYAGVAHCWNALWYHGLLPPQETISKWKAAANRALEIDSNLAEAHLPLANIRFQYEWSWDAAEQGYKRAIELNPNSADARLSYGVFLASRGRRDQAISEGRRALELDPLSLVMNNQVAGIYWLANRLDDALDLSRKIIEIEPSYFIAYWMMGGIYLSKGMHEEAKKAYEQSVIQGGTNMVLSSLGCTYAVMGRQGQALDILNRLLELRKHQYVHALDIARVYMGLGDNDLALEWLEKACDERNGEMVFLNEIARVGSGAAFGEGIRKDPRFGDLLRRAGLTA
jgi:serine/threonine-protein kinase